MSEAVAVKIRIPLLLWLRTLRSLQVGGMRIRECGGFLLGRRDAVDLKATRFVAFDALDPDAYQNGTVAFHDVGYAALWKLCRERGLKVLADLHTHPGPDIRQSETDMRNPVLPMLGHTALIVPHFGHARWFSLEGVGVHEHLGGYRWRMHPTASRVALCAW